MSKTEDIISNNELYESLVEQNKVLIEALEFYADDNNHEQYGSVTYTNELDLDKGFRARQALEKCKEIKWLK